MRTGLLTIASMIILLSIGIGVGWGFQTTVVPTSSGTVTTVTTTASQAQGPYSLTLVITTNNIYNSTVQDQPAYYVLTPHGLVSSASISLPVNTLIELTIMNYDDGNASLTSPSYANVQGTVNGTITYANNDIVNSSQGPNGINIKGAQTVSSVPMEDIAHTFTIPQLGINIPVPVSSIVTTYIKIDKAGTYMWMCETACGSGDTGLEGAMSTSGWMTGDIVASAAAASQSSSPTQSSTIAASSGPYALNIVEIMQNEWNSTAPMQPQFYVLGSHGLESTADISLPVNRVIQVTVMAYDTPTDGATASEGVVSGTIGGTVYLINGSVAAGTANMSMGMSMAMAADWGQNVTSVPASELAHTFTIPQLGINIPVVGGDMVIAYIELHQTGTFTWVCLTPCGLGPDGTVGAMETAGWMTGNIEVS